jgi:predicted transposase/invertase (TIGR01784 family)
VHFREDDSLTKLNQSIQTTFKQRKNMGIEEAILKEVEEKSEKRGEKRGRKEEKLILALNAIKKGFDNETIQELTGLPIEEIEKLRKEGLKG